MESEGAFSENELALNLTKLTFGPADQEQVIRALYQSITVPSIEATLT